MSAPMSANPALARQAANRAANLVACYRVAAFNASGLFIASVPIAKRISYQRAEAFAKTQLGTLRRVCNGEMRSWALQIEVEDNTTGLLAWQTC